MSSEAVMPGRGGKLQKKPGQNASQGEIIRKNVSAIAKTQRREDAGRGLSDRLSDLITAFSGSMLFVLIHVLWFGLWILLNVGLVHVPHVSGFDPFPFGLLTMIVSLEAIFLSTFVLISQNRQARLSEQRAELDLHVNLLAEQKATKVLELLDQIAKQMNHLKRFDLPEDPEVEALKVSPEPQEVLQVLKTSARDDDDAGVERKVDEAVEDISGEVEAVRGEVKESKEEVREDLGRVEEKVDDVADDVEEIKASTGEHARAASFD